MIRLNSDEREREIALDINEGADMLWSNRVCL